VITEMKETAFPQINGTLVPRGQISIPCTQIAHRKAMAKKLTFTICSRIAVARQTLKKGKVYPCTGTEALYRP
jgi:hypothetical protein